MSHGGDRKAVCCWGQREGSFPRVMPLLGGGGDLHSLRFSTTGRFRLAILSKGEHWVGFSRGKVQCKWHLRESVLKVIGHLWLTGLVIIVLPGGTTNLKSNWVGKIRKDL